MEFPRAEEISELRLDSVEVVGAKTSEMCFVDELSAEIFLLAATVVADGSEEDSDKADDVIVLTSVDVSRRMNLPHWTVTSWSGSTAADNKIQHAVVRVRGARGAQPPMLRQISESANRNKQ